MSQTLSAAAARSLVQLDSSCTDTTSSTSSVISSPTSGVPLPAMHGNNIDHNEGVSKSSIARCPVLPYVALCRPMLRYVTLCCPMLRYVPLLRYVAVCCAMLRYVTLCCPMLRYVTLCCYVALSCYVVPCSAVVSRSCFCSLLPSK